MMPFDQLLETSFYLLAGSLGLQSKCIERLAFGVAHRPHGTGGTAGLRGRIKLAKKSEWIVGPGKFGPESGRMGARAWTSAVHTHFPGWTVTNHRVLLITGNVVHAHAGKEIVGMVIFADMFEAEAPIFPLAQPSLWRTVRRRRLAIRPFASR